MEREFTVRFTRTIQEKQPNPNVVWFLLKDFLLSVLVAVIGLGIFWGISQVFLGEVTLVKIGNYALVKYNPMISVWVYLASCVLIAASIVSHYWLLIHRNATDTSIAIAELELAKSLVSELNKTNTDKPSGTPRKEKSVKEKRVTVRVGELDTQYDIHNGVVETSDLSSAV